jgi:DNA-binding IclR family transcriptional regulator
MAVLKGLARLGGRASLTNLAVHLEENPSKVHRYLASLIEEGLVAQDGGSQYYLGPEAIHIGLAAIRQVDPIRVAETSLIRLRERLEVTCFVAVMGNKGPTIMRFEEPGLPVTVNVRTGSVLSLVWSATGRVFLGLLDERRVRDMARDEMAAASSEALAQLPAVDPIGKLQREVRAAGCATVKDVYLRGISAVAAPVYDFGGRVCAVITALGATGGFDASANGSIAKAVRSEAEQTSLALGHTQASASQSALSTAE